MDATWWLALAAVTVLGLIVTLVDGWGRSGRRPRAAGEPRPMEIWWARVPSEDGTGAEDRLCLVLSVRGDRFRVVKITSGHQECPEAIPLPPGSVDDTRDGPDFLEADAPRTIRLRQFRRRAGTVDAAVWDRVRHLTD